VATSGKTTATAHLFLLRCRQPCSRHMETLHLQFPWFLPPELEKTQELVNQGEKY
jgi:hypothetical protein